MLFISSVFYSRTVKKYNLCYTLAKLANAIGVRKRDVCNSHTSIVLPLGFSEIKCPLWSLEFLLARPSPPNLLLVASYSLPMRYSFCSSVIFLRPRWFWHIQIYDMNCVNSAVDFRRSFPFDNFHLRYSVMRYLSHFCKIIASFTLCRILHRVCFPCKHSFFCLFRYYLF